MNEATNKKTVDVAVIGAGTAGLAAYRAARAAGASAVIVEGGAHGTTCARVGCMPSKLLIAAADAAHKAREAAPFGLKTTVEIDGKAVMERVRRERDRFVGFVIEGIDKIPAEDHIRGWASFASANVLDVALQPGVHQQIEAKSIVVATGSRPFVPAMFDRVRDRVMSNEDVFMWKELPKSVVVFGMGIIGLELGQALHRLGVRVRLFGRGGAIGMISDPLVRDAAQEIFQKELSADPDAKIESVTPSDDGGVTVTWLGKDGVVHVETFEKILVAAGRRPNIDTLHLENAGVAAGATLDRETLRLGESHVFLAGDVNDELPLLHEAADDGSIAGANAARYPVVNQGFRRSQIGIAFTDPGLAVVGPGFEELSSHKSVVAGLVRFEDQGRSRVMLENRGALRIYADPKTGTFLGAEMIAPRAEHLAHLLAWAHQQKLTIDQMLAMPFYHPVVEEGVRTALRDTKSKLAAGEQVTLAK